MNTTDQQIKAIITQILKREDLGLLEIIKISDEQKLTVREVGHVLRMLTFFRHKYIENTTDWFRNSKSSKNITLTGRIQSLYMFLGITTSKSIHKDYMIGYYKRLYYNVQNEALSGIKKGKSQAEKDEILDYLIRKTYRAPLDWLTRK